jgi:NCAIR mutase (PurE)-related protein
MFREISFLLDTYGYELTPGKELVENTEKDLDKLGTIQTTEKYLLKLNTPKKGQVTINFERSVDEKQLMPLIEKILKLNNDTLTPELENEILRNLAIKDKDTTIMTGTKGIVSFVEHQREVGFAKNLLSTHLLRITLE